MLSIQQMHYILALEETGQFQKASERCFVTQPTLSMQIKKAEDDLGSSIFDRSRIPLELTEFGTQLIPILRDILSENSKIGLLKDRMHGVYKEHIRIGIIPTIAVYLVPEMFGVWQRKFPSIQLTIEEMKTHELIEALEQKKIDLALFAGPHHDPVLQTIHLFTEEIFAYLPSYSNDSISVQELSEMQPWLLNKGNCLRTQMISFCEIKEGEKTSRWDYEGGNLEILMKMVDLNGGYSLVPANYPLASETKDLLKRILSIQGMSPAREIIGCYPKRTIKKEYCEKLLREIQLNYSHDSKNQVQIIDWKG
jgi:LysR family hydrogen peroxide-inducible transcriptional activator